MAFFSVMRYKEDEGVSEKQDQASSILQKLHEAADRKRKSQQFQPLPDGGLVENDKSPTKKVKTNTSLIEESVISKRKQKKKHETSDDPMDSSVFTETTVESGKLIQHDNAQKTRKKKKSEYIEKSSVSGTHSDSNDCSNESKINESLNSSQIKTKKDKKTKTKLQDVSVDSNMDIEIKSDKTGGKSKIKRTKPDVSLVAEDHSSESTEEADETEPVEDKDCVDDSGDHVNTVADESSVKEKAFAVIGHVHSKRLPKVERVLPHWLSHPTVITDDIRNKRTPLEDVKGLHMELLDKLRQNGIKDFFPVQAELLPELLHSFRYGCLHGNAGFRPSDICCSAPTGSGKTLAYALPIIQALQQRVVCQVRALVVLPVRDLVTQVYKVFLAYCKDTNIKVGHIVGSKTFSSEQHMLVRNGPCGYESLCDILVSTPGRLVDHINTTPGFSLRHLRFLVIDEADRMMDDIKQDWLRYVEDAVYSKGNHDKYSSSNHDNQNTPGNWGSVTKDHVKIFGDIQREPSGIMTVTNACKPQLVLQKLLFSATLSQNPEKLQQLNLFRPKLFTSIVDSKKGSHTTDVAKTGGEFIGKFTTPAGLTEFYLESTVGQKPLMLLRFIQHLKYRYVLCFTNSIDTAHRLYWLIKLTCDVEVREISSKQLNDRRNRILKQFSDGKVDIIVCSDAMARGMDIENVRYVISYDNPPYLKTYIHRAGRTARAGKVGTAITLLEKKEIFHFKQMLKEGGKSGLREERVKASELKPYVPQYTKALTELEQIIQSESQR